MSKKIASLYAEIGAKIEPFQKGAKQVKGELGGIEKSFSDFAKNNAADFLSMGATFAAVAKGIQVVTVAASDLAESQSKVNVVFGESARQVQDWSNTTANSMGISQQAALEAAGTYGNLFTALGLTQDAAAGMSTELVQLAADLASFNNQNPEDVLLALRSGLSGEVEPLKRFGIAMNEATMKAKAMELGLGDNLKALTEAEKVQVRYAIVLDQTTTAQGDFARTSEGLANTMRQLKANTDDLKSSLGEAFEPTVTEAANAINDLTVSLAGSVKAENALLQAVEDGLITQEDANRQINKFTWTSYEAADAMEWLSEKQELNKKEMEAIDTLYGSFDQKFRGHIDTLEEGAVATQENEKAIKEMTKANEGWLKSIGYVTEEQASYQEKLQEVANDERLTLEERQAKMDEYTTGFEENKNKRIFGMIEEQLAADGLTLAETEYLQELGLQWGIYTDSAVSAMQEAQTQAQLFADFFNNLPDEKVMTLRLETRGFDQNLAGFAAENTIRSMSGRGRASGGPVWPGASFLVGERGPEIFTPSQSGNITPNGGGAGMFSQSDIEALTSAFTTALMRANG